ncbi:class II fructose-bisphosphate aldolase [Anaerolentibacter hominis]|uniref:class II fructose-bisphosphate aldolase n=1 Tax=Anaerolentibacter hominis TaxID=3079009 RepID=UPI0031B886D1
MEGITGNTLRKMLKDADEGGYAVPMFNFSGLPDLLGLMDAAKEMHAPVMFASASIMFDAIDAETLGGMGVAQMKKMETPAILHLDHSNTVELCKEAIDNGYPSVMIDASKLSLEENISTVKQVVEYAHPRNVFVEGEIGKIKGRDYEGTFLGDDFLVQVPDAVELVEKSGVDSLAVGIGTAHGFYQGKPELNFKRLAEVNEAVSIPLVLHGGTGIPEEDVRKAISLGINKVNVGTQIRYTYLKTVQDILNEKTISIHTKDIILAVRKAVCEDAKKWIKVCMADGKA